MNLSELSKEYRISGEKCRERVKELEKLLKSGTLTEKESILLKRRLTILISMTRETLETANYLARYYRGRRENV